VKNVPGQVQAVGTQASKSFDQAWGALQLWAAGLDGKITGEELKKIQDSVGDGWGNTQAARDYLKGINDRINAGQADQVVQEALQVVGQQANEKKVQVMRSVSDFMKSNGVTWEQTQQVIGKWVVQVLKLSPMDVVNFVKSLDH
jgi:intergrase/recombinase